MRHGSVGIRQRKLTIQVPTELNSKQIHQYEVVAKTVSK
jgi:hypothetical protein